jgi:alkylation response protein AidB-like acyl-CoA dehydrogenase
MRAVAWARVAASAQLSGIARGCLLATTDYVSQRTQFNRTLSAFQSVSHRCADMLVGVELSDAVWRFAAAEVSVAKQPESLACVYAAKARSGDVALTTGRTAVQLHGAMGFTEECAIGLYLRAAMQYSSWLGAPAAMRRLFLARSGQRDLLMEACND